VGNRKLLAVIRDQKPQSIVELAKLTGRAAPNVTRTLQKMEAVGLVKMKPVMHSKAKAPVAAVKTLHVQIDPFAQKDVLELA
jgi:predicted transcriptional regulator